MSRGTENAAKPRPTTSTASARSVRRAFHRHDAPKEHHVRSPRLGAAATRSTVPHTSDAVEPIFLANLHNKFADFPYTLCAIGPDASHVGNLMRFRVRPERTLRIGFTSHPTFHCIFTGHPVRTGARHKMRAFPSVWSTSLGLTPFTGPLNDSIHKECMSSRC